MQTLNPIVARSAPAWAAADVVEDKATAEDQRRTARGWILYAAIIVASAVAAGLASPR